MQVFKIFNPEKESLLSQLRSLPLIIESETLKQRKKHIEEELIEKESAIKYFSRSRVYIPTKDYNEL